MLLLKMCYFPPVVMKFVRSRKKHLTKAMILVVSTMVSIWIALLSGSQSILLAQGTSPQFVHTIEPGDTWRALAWRFGVAEGVLRNAYPHINSRREPTIGTDIVLPVENPPAEKSGIIIRTDNIGILEIGVQHNANPWRLAILNEIRSPYSPLLNRPIFIPGGDRVPRELPMGFNSFDLTPFPIQPGQPIGFRAQLNRPVTVTATLADVRFVVPQKDDGLVGIAGTGAFFPIGTHELVIVVDGFQPWVQPLYLRPGEWTYEQINLTGPAAAIDQTSIKEERERLSVIWSEVTPEIRWRGLFQLPIDNFVDFSSLYGAHRSYNGGPYNSYHKGLDFSAYGGTPVLAPAAGTAALAEFLYVRGGAVIIEHGYGIFSGLYHMSEVLVQPGQHVEEGQIIGRVGSTGLSTGNHLHWDLLVGGTQVDALAWRDMGLGCWFLEGLGSACN